MTMKNAISWFELPATDLDRAQKFYETILNIHMIRWIHHIVPKTEISPEHGHMAIFIDTEGNRVALHSVPPRG